MMYLDHFGLRVDPFPLTPDTELFVDEGGRGEILKELLRAILVGEGFIKVVGEVGSGKTMLCRTLCRRLPNSVQVALLLHPNLPPGKLISAILQEFRLASGTENGFLEERRILLDHLVALHRQGQRAVLLIEEAHRLSEALLEELRILSNLETGRAKLLQIVLFGQPGLDRMLRDQQTHPLYDRFTTSLVLMPLSLQETEQHLHSALLASGYSGEHLFTTQAVRCLHRTSRGKMRRLNMLANKSLQAACSESARTVSLRHVMRVISINESVHVGRCWHQPSLAAAGVAALFVGGFAWYSWATSQTLGIALQESVLQSGQVDVARTLEHGDAPLALVQSMNVGGDDPGERPGASVRVEEPAFEVQAASGQTLATGAVSEQSPGVEMQGTGATLEAATGMDAGVAGAGEQASGVEMQGTGATLEAATGMDAGVAGAGEQVPGVEMPGTGATVEVATGMDAGVAGVGEEERGVEVHAAASLPGSARSDGAESVLAAAPIPYLKLNDEWSEQILASHRWLENGDESHVTIQMVLLQNESGVKILEQQLAAITPPLPRIDLKMFRIKSDALLIYLNEFSSMQEAREFLSRLPGAFRVGASELRTLARLKKTVNKLALATSSDSGA